MKNLKSRKHNQASLKNGKGPDRERISEIFNSIARILEIKQDNRFRIRAYQRAAGNLRDLSQDLGTLIKEDRLFDIPGVGRDLAGKIKEIAATGKLKYYEELKKSIPSGLLDLLNIPSVGPKTAWDLYQKLKIKNIQDLEQAIENDKLSGLFGIKEKTVENIRQGLLLFKKGKERMPLALAIQAADEFMLPLSELDCIGNISPAGSLRRRKDTVRDIDILIESNKPSRVMDSFTGLPGVKKIQAKGKTKSSVLNKQDIQVDCRVVPAKSFGAALLYFTGSKNFNIKLRRLAMRMGLKINEYAISSGNKYLAGRSEKDIFKILKMSYLAPELREDNGELELALKHELPKLVDLRDIRSDLHLHSNFSDGENSIEEMARSGRARGYTHIAISDHSQSLKVAGGLGLAELKKKKAVIERLNKGLHDFRVLFGSEVEIDSEGNLDYPQGVLEGFDIVVAAIHSGFRQSKEKLTERLIRACLNPHVHIIAHPTGRLWGSREAYQLDFKRLFKACRETNTALEINGDSLRLDLNDINCRRARAEGVRLVIGSDAHSTDRISQMELGVSVARRAWLEAKDLLNCLSVEELLRAIRKKKSNIPAVGEVSSQAIPTATEKIKDEYQISKIKSKNQRCK
ncbi:MAG: DNA polymerase/3'-5' exonuclease PolX [Candidatus Omnitrophica bacterium]|nr:DNA polymerase/3'-5' exonuclease PolX [Candidatus Omnitrophota bacterium]